MDKLTCNKCSKECDHNKNYDVNLYHHFKVMFHYGSDHDFEKWKYNLCEQCVLEFVSTFQIEPDKSEYDWDEEMGLVGKEII